MPNKTTIKAKEWFDVGTREYEFAKLNYSDPQNKFYSEMCFMFHQSVEKLLKGFLVLLEIDPPKIHDCRILCSLCAEHEKMFADHVDKCAKLNKYYISTRYPVHYEIMSKSDAKEAFSIASDILHLIKK